MTKKRKMISELIGKKEKTKKKRSVFDLTINTNKSLNTRNSAVLDRLPQIKECLKELGHNLMKLNNVEKLLIDMNDPNSKPRILEFETSAQIESNTEGKGMLHMHIIYSITHETKIKFDLPLLKNIIYKYLEKCLSFPFLESKAKFYKPYVNIRGRHDDGFSMREYVKSRKGPNVENI